jgi:hypothetical protein
MGEAWMQTASLVSAIQMPMFAQTNMDVPEPEDNMPQRYLRRKKRVSDLLPRVDSQAAAQQLGGMIRAGK